SDLRFDPTPLMVASNRAVYQLSLAPGDSHEIGITVSASTRTDSHQVVRDDPPSVPLAARGLRASAYGIAAESARVKTDDEVFSALFEQSLADVQMLLTTTPHGEVPYAGVPWYVAPFGRDSIITALQLLPYNAGVAAGTLRFLAAW